MHVNQTYVCNSTTLSIVNVPVYRGVHPDMWDGAATIMGNNKNQWVASYAREGMRNREAQQAVQFVSQRRAEKRKLDQAEPEGQAPTTGPELTPSTWSSSSS